MSKVIGGITKALVIEPDGKGKGRSGRKPSGEPIFDRAKVKHKDFRQSNFTDLLYNITCLRLMFQRELSLAMEILLRLLGHTNSKSHQQKFISTHLI